MTYLRYKAERVASISIISVKSINYQKNTISKRNKEVVRYKTHLKIHHTQVGMVTFSC